MFNGNGLHSPFPASKKPPIHLTLTTRPRTPQQDSDSTRTPVSPTTATTRHDSAHSDGKTASCDREHTFDSFVPPHKLGVDKEPKRVGATWDVVRAIVKLKRLRKMRRKERRVLRGEGGRVGMMR
jgi:hypothetical protein